MGQDSLASPPFLQLQTGRVRLLLFMVRVSRLGNEANRESLIVEGDLLKAEMRHDGRSFGEC